MGCYESSLAVASAALAVSLLVILCVQGIWRVHVYGFHGFMARDLL